MPSSYSESDIQVLEGLAAVRKRPGMYIGSTSSRGLHHLLWEILDNAKDEVLSGHNQWIEVILYPDGSVSVEDRGRGIPTGMHATGRPTPEVIFTVLHSGGKFGGSSYTVSGGLHGVGASVVNALSAWLEVQIYRDGQHYRQRFETLNPDEPGVPVTSLEVVGPTKKRGTKVHFKPDPRVFKPTELNYDLIYEKLCETAFLLKGVKIHLADWRFGQLDGDEREGAGEFEKAVREAEFYYPEGIRQFVTFLNEGKNPLHGVIYFCGEREGIDIELAMQYNDGYTESLTSFVNSIPTPDGGTHETGFRTAHTRVFNDYARKLGLLKERDANLTGSDVREGFMGILSLRMHEIEFEGQTKARLGNAAVRQVVEAFVGEKLGFFMEENPEIAAMLIERAVRAARVREQVKKARELARGNKKNGKRKKFLSEKYTPCQSKNPAERELYIVEGDSAGGSAKQGRDRKTMSILSLKGKPMNSEKAKLSDIMANEELQTIIDAIDAGVGADFEVEKAKYGKVIVMTDADVDGSHIQALLLTFFYRYMKPMVEAGRIYIAQPPLYKVTKKRTGKGKKKEDESIIYCYTDEELEEVTRGNKNYELQRYKGLGEMNPDQLWETTMNPETRTLIQVSLEDAAQIEKMITTLMGEKVPPRREWIATNVDFIVDEE